MDGGRGEVRRGEERRGEERGERRRGGERKIGQKGREEDWQEGSGRDSEEKARGGRRWSFWALQVLKDPHAPAATAKKPQKSAPAKAGKPKAKKEVPDQNQIVPLTVPPGVTRASKAAGVKQEILEERCYSCERPFSEVKKASVDGCGTVVTDGCLDCLTVLAEGWPGVTWAQCKMRFLICVGGYG